MARASYFGERTRHGAWCSATGLVLRRQMAGFVSAVDTDAPNQKWAGDISYVWTREGWLYLAVILDLHSRRVIGWAVSNRMKRDLPSGH